MAIESESEFGRFAALVDTALSVSKDELDKRVIEDRKRSLMQPVRRGPKIDQQAALRKLEEKSR